MFHSFKEKEEDSEINTKYEKHIQKAHQQLAVVALLFQWKLQDIGRQSADTPLRKNPESIPGPPWETRCSLEHKSPGSAAQAVGPLQYAIID